MLNEDRRRTAPRSDERGMVRRRNSPCFAYPIPAFALYRAGAMGLFCLNRALTCPRVGSRRGETAPSRCAVWRLMRCLVLGDDRGRNAAALAYLVSTLPSPGPDLRAALTARASSGTTTPAAATALASMVDVLTENPCGVCPRFPHSVDLVGSAVEAERHSLRRLAPIEIVDDSPGPSAPWGASLSAEQAIRESLKHIPEALRLPIRRHTDR